jgi:limonene-1,2-epoxide hydrolase
VEARMYIDISSVDKLMKSTIEKKLFLNSEDGRNYSAVNYIREKAAIAMLDQVMKRKQKSNDILEIAADAMLVHVNKRKQEFSKLEILQSIS